MDKKYKILIAIILTVSILLLIGFVVWLCFFRRNNGLQTSTKLLSNEKYNKNFPRNLHLMYIPWDKNKQFKSNYNDFDHKFFYKFKQEHPEWNIYLWNYSRLKTFATKYYPEYWNLVWSNFTRPVTIIDCFRLLVVYHYGGIYWQYESTLKNNITLEHLIPEKEDQIILLIESILSEKQCNDAKKYRIRDGKPEEKNRVATQVFSANPKHPFLRYCMDKICKNLVKYSVNEDYDILYIAGNAMISEAYHECIKKGIIHPSKLVLVKNNYVDFSSKGSWRTD
jgi:mannosyltransferase OCH1-like enzyme